MKRTFTHFRLLLLSFFFITQAPLWGYSQCGAGEAEYQIEIITGSFPEEAFWEIVPSAGGDPVIEQTCGNLLSGIFTFCLTEGVEYTFNAYDEYGDSWNGGTFNLSYPGGLPSLDSGTPDNGMIGDQDFICGTGADLEYSFSFVATALNCEVPVVTINPGCDGPGETFEINVSVSGGSSETYDIVIDGITVDAGISTPFSNTYGGYPNNVSVNVDVIGDDPVCNYSRNIVGDCTPGPMTDCGEHSSFPNSYISNIAPVTDVITISGTGQVIEDLDISVDITHSWVSDLAIRIISPLGTSVVLWQQVCYGNDLKIRFDDNSSSIMCGPPTVGQYHPTGSLSIFNGEPIDGDWTLEVVDLYGGDEGTLLQWCILPELTDPSPCPLPVGLNASNVSFDGLNFTWAFLGETGTSEIEIGAVGFVPGTGAAFVNVSGNESGDFIGGLNPQTTYHAYISYDCGNGDVTGWAGPFSFTTVCAPFTAPYFENFNSWSSNWGEINQCWTNNPSGTNQYFWTSVTGDDGYYGGGPTGDHSALQNGRYAMAYPWNGGPGSVANITSPMIDLSPLDVPALKFSYFMFGTGMGSLHVDILAADFTVLETDVVVFSGNQQFSQNDSWLSTIVALPDYADQTIRVRFRAIRGTNENGDIAIDNVRLQEAPTCVAPIVAFDVESDCENNEYFINVDISDMGSASTLNITNNGNLPATNGIDEAGVYSIGPFSGGSTASLTVVFVGETDCNVLSPIFSFPICPFLPPTPCGLNLTIPDGGCPNGNSLEIPLIVDEGPGQILGETIDVISVSVIIDHPWIYNVEIHLRSPEGTEIPLSIQNGGGPSVDYGNPENCPEEVTIFTMEASTPITSGTAPFIGSFIPQGDFAAFNGENPNGMWTLRVCDQWTWDIGTLEYVNLVIDDCAPVLGLTTDLIAADQVDISWNGFSGAEGFEVTWEPGGGNIILDGNTEEYSITGLDPETQYTVEVTTLCGEGATSSPVSTSFTTTICPIADLCYYELYLYDSYGDGWNGNSIEIDINGSVNNYTIFEGNIAVFPIEFCGEEGTGTISVAYNNTGSWQAENSYELYLNGDLLFGDGPNPQPGEAIAAALCTNCLVPSGFETTNTTDQSISLQWEPVSGFEDYTVSWEPGGGSVLVEGATSYTIEGLNSGTAYTVSVAIFCAETGEDVASSIIAYTTTCTPAEQCHYTLELLDDWGDGWNGGNLQVGVGGAVTNYTLNTGGFAEFTISACPADELILNFNTGGLNSGEIRYILYSPEGFVIFDSGWGPAVGTIFETIACPACPNPFNIDITDVTNEGFNVSWTSGGGELIPGNNFTVSWRNVPNEILCILPTSDCGSQGIPSATSYEVTGLLYPGETYTVCVQSNCAGGDGSSFQICEEVTLYTCSPEEQCFYTLEMFDTAWDGWNGANLQITVGGTTNNYSLQSGQTGSVQIPACPEDDFELYYNESGTWPGEISFNLIGPEGNTLFSSVQGPSEGTSFNTVACPSCPGPYNLGISGVTATSAVLEWEDISSALSYEITWQPGNGSVTVGGDVNSYELTGLTEGALVEVNIFSNCEDGEVSAPLTGEIQLLACPMAERCEYTFRFYDDYGDGSNGGVFELSNGGLTMSYTLTSGALGEFPFFACPGLPIVVEFVTPGSWASEIGFELVDNFNQVVAFGGTLNGQVNTIPVGTQFTVEEACPSCGPVSDLAPGYVGDLEMDVTWTSYNIPGVEYDVYLGLPGFDYTNGAEVIASATGVTGSNPQMASLSGLEAETGYEVVVVENCESISPGDGQGEPVYIQISTNNTCPTPTNASAQNVGSTSFTASFFSMNPGANYSIYWGTPGFTPGVDEIGMVSGTSILGENDIDISGLTMNTSYEVVIQEDCEIIEEGNGQSGILSFQFSTLNIPNNTCQEAIALTVNDAECEENIYTLANSTNTLTSCANGESDRDVWFSFVATQEVMSITVTPSVSFAPIVELFGGSCNSLSSMCCAFNGGLPWNVPVNMLTPTLVVGETYYVAVGDYFTPVTNTFTICIEEPEANYCEMDGVADIMEAEGCQQDLNGTCATAQPVAFPAMGETATLQGSGWASCNFRDLDNYSFVITEETMVSVEAESQFPHIFQIWNITNGCDGIYMMENYANACTPTTFSGILNPGTYRVFITPNTFNGFPCGFGNDYQISVTANTPPPSPEDSCGEYTSSPNQSIPSNTSNITNVITVEDTDEIIEDMDVVVKINHTWISDISLISVTSPEGTVVNLWTSNCGANDNLEVHYNDGAPGLVCGNPTEGIFDPVGSLANFNGETFAGDWTLTINNGIDPGTLVSWCLIPTLSEPVGSNSCDEAVEIVPAPYFAESEIASSIAGVSPSGEAQCVDGGTPHADRWFKYTAVGTNMYIRAWGLNDFDAVVEVYDACGGEQIICQNNAGPGLREVVIVNNSVIGQEYVYRVYSAGASDPATESFTTAVAHIPFVQLANTSCNNMNLTLGSIISSTVPDDAFLLTNYSFEFTELEAPYNVYEVVSPNGVNPQFIMSWLPQAEYGRSYSVRTRARMFQGPNWGEYGEACTIAIQELVPATGLAPQFNGGTFDYCDLLYAVGVGGATNYSWTFTADGQPTINYSGNNYYLPLQGLPFVPGVTYDVNVYATVGGTQAVTSIERQLTINPDVPETQMNTVVNACGLTYDWFATIYAVKVCNATSYTWKFTNTSQVQDDLFYVRTGGAYNIKLNWVAGLIPGDSYDVSVYATIPGAAPGEFGPACNITIQAPDPLMPQEVTIADSETDKSISEIEIVSEMYPNPNKGDVLYLHLNNLVDEQQEISVEVYDMYGKRLHNEVFGNHGNNLNAIIDFKNDLANGVYHVSIIVNDKIVSTQKLIVH